MLARSQSTRWIIKNSVRRGFDQGTEEVQNVDAAILKLSEGGAGDQKRPRDSDQLTFMSIKLIQEILKHSVKYLAQTACQNGCTCLAV